MAKILIAGLNPAWQQIFTLPTLRLDAVNRAEAFVELASGKGMNAAKILVAQGHEVSLWQVLAGENGRRLQAACERLGIRSLHEFTDGETRTCATLLHAGETTEVIAPFSVIGDATLAERLLSRLPDERFDALLVCGTVPSGLEAASGSGSHVLEGGVIASAVARLQAGLTIWDSGAGLTAELLARIDWLKVNAEEYRALAPVLSGASKSSPVLSGASASPSRLITDGARPALVKARAARAELCAVPSPGRVVNPIGAGDTVTAMLADGLLRGLDPRAASARALAAASASCLNVLPAVWSPDDAARLLDGIRWSDAALEAAPAESAGAA